MTPEIFEEMSRYYDKLKQVRNNDDFVFEVHLVNCKILYMHAQIINNHLHA